ncbi:protein DpdE [Lentzea sp. NPDC055074]
MTTSTGEATVGTELLNKFSPSSRFVHQWVKVRSNDYGYGYCVERRPDGALVEYTDIPGVVAKRIVVPFDELEVARVAKGTRVWVRGDPYGWHAAEVTDATGFGEYRVRIRGLPRDAKIKADLFRVRWNRPLSNPLVALTSGICDSPEYYEARRAFRDQLLLQRKMSRGFTGVLSAAVDLFPHQLDTVARVLSDPVIRYLLADEVGLGKTIEAGLILRQLLLDDPQATALVAVPEPLIQQWFSELRGRLLLSRELSAGRIKLITHEQLTDEASLHEHALVTIDEAHNALEYIEKTPGLQREIHSTKGLLLLSATPMRGNLEIFLSLLNLIDPIAFPHESIQDFEHRIAARESEATSLDVLTSNRASLTVRRSVLDKLQTMHSTDQILARLVEECRVSNPDAPAWKELAHYVRETYRISRRMVRHRRNTEPTEQYPVAGRTAKFLPISDPARAIVDDFLNQYCDLHGRSTDPVLFGRMVVHGLGGPRPLLRHLEHRLTVAPQDKLYVTEHERALFKATAAKLDLAGTSIRFDAVLDFVEERLDAGETVVVVGTSAVTAKEFYDIATSRWKDMVGGHLSSMSARARDADTARFLSPSNGFVLVGDYTIEEGRNLQNAHVLVNLDLPLDPNRLEQRIGRLDRFARRTEPAMVLVVTEPNSEWVTSHIRLLHEGIGIFDSSVATLQQKLAMVLDELTDKLQSDGSLAFELDLATLRESLEDEKSDVDLLEELESVTVASDFDDAGVAELQQAEADASALRAAFAHLTSPRGGLELRPMEHPISGVVQMDSTPERSILGVPQDISAQLLPLLKQPRAFSRHVTTSRTGVAPLRLGDPLVDWLEHYLRVDERGRARAVVRPYAGVNVPTLWVSCDFLVEFDASHLEAENEAVRRRLRRRGDALLPPTIERTWTDDAGPADSVTAQVLDRPFADRSDRLLKGSEWRSVLAELPDWRGLCTAGAETAWETVRATPALTTAPASAADQARREASRRLAVLEARSQRLPSEAERKAASLDLAREKKLGEALVQGVENAAVSVVACGAVVLWPTR